MCTRANDTAGKPADSTTETSAAPCSTCAGTGFHPSADLPTSCGACEGAGVITSAIDIHADVDLHASAIANLLAIAVRLDDPLPGERSALRYAALHLTVQALAMVDAPRRRGDSLADRQRAESLLRASGELAALHAVLMDAGGETERAALEGGALIAGSIAGRMGRVEDELAALST